MRVKPFVEVDGTPFTATAADVRAVRGEPMRAERNAVGLNALDYGEVVFRFQDNGRLEEITARSPVLHLGTVAVPFAALADFVAAQDPEAFRRAGFVVSPAFGLAFDPTEPPWVTALAAHCLDEWRAL
ncbi:hypothetical protein [Rhizobacter sp. LjRoot28]|uniref:hypothetical protein n=1 Tax=Rhizobacter sp. LjRoot28 TaxID=3342309 RepID=UPI003ECD40FE